MTGKQGWHNQEVWRMLDSFMTGRPMWVRPWRLHPSKVPLVNEGRRAWIEMQPVLFYSSTANRNTFFFFFLAALFARCFIVKSCSLICPYRVWLDFMNLIVTTCLLCIMVYLFRFQQRNSLATSVCWFSRVSFKLYFILLIFFLHFSQYFPVCSDSESETFEDMFFSFTE